MRGRIGAVLGLLAVLLLMANSSKADVTFTDDTFTNVEWSTTVFNTNGCQGTAAALEVAVGGNPGQFMRHHLTLFAGGSGNVWAFSHLMTAVYDPAVSGAIDHIDYSHDIMMISPNDLQNAYAPAIRQNGIVYLGGYLRTAGTFWDSQLLSGLKAADFYRLDGPGTPDFSANGPQMELGLAVGHSVANPNHIQREYYSGIDNWRLTIVPEPATMSLLAIGLGAMAMRRRKRDR
jgi:hypothetical protein